MRRFAVLLAWCMNVNMSLGLGLSAQTPEATIPLLDQGYQAEAAENYQRAIELYQQAARELPEATEPSQALGRLFAAQGLHRLALPAWEDVLKKAPDDREAWFDVAQTHGLLNQDTVAAEVYQRALGQFPGDLELAQALAWMLFKIEKFQQGIDLLLELTNEQPTTAGIEMVLGTLYSSIYDQDLARLHYLQSIALTPGSSLLDRTFRSIAWYNLSLLEKDFYRFEASEEALQKSLAAQERPANHLALGELKQDALDEKAARQHFITALETDDTPLSQFDLATLDQLFGRIEEAKAGAAKVAAHQDESWIVNFGVTKEKFQRDQEKLLADIYRSSWLRLDLQPRTTPWDWLVWLGKKIAEGLQWWYHDQEWKRLLVKTSEASLQVSNSPEAWINLTLANRDHPAVSLKYLTLSRQHELPRNPLARPSYDLEEGLIAGDLKLVADALGHFQAPGENADRARALVRLAGAARERGDQRESRRRLTELFALAPGVMPGEGLGLPVRTAWYGTDTEALSQWKAVERDYAAQAGWDLGPSDRPGVEWSLDFQVFGGQDPKLYWTLRDNAGEGRRTGNLAFPAEKKMEALASIYFQIHHNPY